MCYKKMGREHSSMMIFDCSRKLNDAHTSCKLCKQNMVDKNEPPAEMDLHCGLENLGPDGTYYMGGVNNGLGLGKLHVN